MQASIGTPPAIGSHILHWLFSLASIGPSTDSHLCYRILHKPGLSIFIVSVFHFFRTVSDGQTINPTFTSTSRCDLPAVQSWEESQGLNFSLPQFSSLPTISDPVQHIHEKRCYVCHYGNNLAPRTTSNTLRGACLWIGWLLKDITDV